MEVTLTFFITKEPMQAWHRTEVHKKTIKMPQTDRPSIIKRACHMYPGWTMKVEVKGEEPYIVPRYLR